MNKYFLLGIKLFPLCRSLTGRDTLKTLKIRDRNCQIVKRRGRLYVINKRNPRFKARQG